MGFAFGFSGEDISDDDQVQNNTPNDQAIKNSLPEVLAPSLHTLDELLSTLQDVRLSFDNYMTPNGNTVYRRHLFDIKHQVMVEETDNLSEVQNILIGNTNDEVDVQKNVYEGGFKSWECSYDLVDKLNELATTGRLQDFSSLLELGCGTALPACYLFMLQFSQHLDVALSLKKIVFADFNYDVLRLVTLPNLLIHWASTLGPEKLISFMNPDIPLNNDELILTPALLEHFKQSLRDRKMEVSFISGSWGPKFEQIASSTSPDLILSSETIYSEETIPVVSNTLISLLTKNAKYLSLIAAKSYYFGVGGSIREFLRILDEAKPDTMHVQSVGGDLGQLKRDIIQLSS